MLTPHPVNEQVAAEEFQQQTEVLKEVRVTKCIKSLAIDSIFAGKENILSMV